MDDERDRKRRNKHRDDDEVSGENRSKRRRSRSRSPARRGEKEFRQKRRHSRSKSPADKHRKEAANDVKKEAPVRKNKDTDMLNTRTGGAYIPPARLRMMQAQITDKSSVAYQRLAWEALKKSIHGHINKINVGNIGIIIKELLRENIVRGRGLLCRSVIQAQAASPTFTNVYAALVAAVNSRFPNIGELLLKRLVIQFKRGFKRNDKPICISSASFIAHLVNQRVAHEILALELLTLLVETPTDDSVEVAIAFLKECGQKLTEVSSKGCNAIFEMLRNILHEGQLDKRVQYMIEVMFQVWKDGFKDHPALIEELELVPEEDQFTHLLMLDDATDAQDILNVFKFDDKYEENEQKYKDLSKEILGSDAESGEEGSGSESGSDEEEEESEEAKPVTIIDNTETNLIALRRTIYLTINSSLDFEECAHKLMKMQLKPGQEVELCHMFLDCCAEQRTYEKFYGLLAQRFCNINRIYISPFEEIFKDSYGTAHRLDTNRLRNVSKFFAHLLFTDSISWEVLECVKLNEEDTTSSSRIYIKILFQELAEYMGLKKLNDRLKDPTLQGAFLGVFPRDNPKNTRFSINFFTSIGLGGLTDELREHLKQMPKNVPPAITEIKVDTSSSSDSSSSSSDSSSSDSDKEENEEGSKSKKKNKKSKKKDDSPKPRTPAGDNNLNILKQAKERWGHDGFFETYGKDAQRHEPRREVDEDNFVKPFPKDKTDRRNGDERRRKTDSDSRNDGEDRGRREDRGKRSEDDGYESRSKDRSGRRDDRDPRNNRIDDEERSRRSDKERSDDRDRKNDREDRSNKESRRNDREERNDTESRRNDKEDRNERENRRNDKERDANSDERDPRRNDRGDRNDRDTRRYDHERDSRRNDKEDRNDRESRRNDKERDESSDERDLRRNDRGDKNDRDSRRYDDERKSRKNDDERDNSRNAREDINKRDSRRNDKEREERPEDKEIRRVEREDRNEQDIRRNDREKDRGNKESRRNDREDKNERDTRRDDRDDKRTKKQDDEGYESRSKKKDKVEEKKRKDSEESESDGETERKSKKDKRKEKKRKDSSEESDSDTDRKKEKKSKKNKRKEKEDSSDSEPEKKKKSKKDKKSRKEKENEWDIKTKDDLDKETKNKKHKPKTVDTKDWDIHREGSIKREIPGRYWDSNKTRHEEDREMSPRDSDRRRDR